MPDAEWFSGARLNYAENLLAGKPPERLALQHASELRELDALTWGELHDQVARVASALRGLGIEPGDRVVAYMPNVPETLIAFLASASIGAIWSSCSPDFGAGSVVDRFAQIEPKLLFCVDGYRYAGRDFDRTDVVADLLAQMPSVSHTVVLPYLDPEPDLSPLRNPTTWDQLLASGRPGEIEFEQVAFDHPLWVLYSSGTTGLPKAIVHGHGGILLEQRKKLTLHLDAQEGDRVFWFTTTGWMMWNFLCGVLLTEASIVLYDGSPGHPDMGVLWDLAERAQITCFGTSASYVAACMKADVEPGAGRDLSALRAVGSTGSPLAPEGFQWIYDHVGADTWLFSTSGGTDVCTAFVGGVPTLPVYRGELQARSLGCAVEAFDEDGHAVIDQVGELVITEPLPSMPIGFWGDPDGSRYRASYFDMYPGIWRHGDWIEITSRGTAIIYGRSDSTINRSGVRMGTSEIYRAVASVPEVTDALVVDVPRPGTEGWMPLFVVLADGVELGDELKRELGRRIREQCSPRHVPDEVYEIAEVPRTLSGKVLEVPVKRILTGTPPEQAASRDSLANPAALDWFVELSSKLASDT
jgi:acetoacetyl-CoA synthetase